MPKIAILWIAKINSILRLNKWIPHDAAYFASQKPTRMLTVFLQPEQNCSAHVGQCTRHGTFEPAPKPMGCTETTPMSIGAGSSWSSPLTRQTVSQPAFGHHVRDLSRSTSADVRKVFLVSSAEYHSYIYCKTKTHPLHPHFPPFSHASNCSVNYIRYEWSQTVQSNAFAHAYLYFAWAGKKHVYEKRQTKQLHITDVCNLCESALIGLSECAQTRCSGGR